jgi:serine/threonine-protein kinase
VGASSTLSSPEGPERVGRYEILLPIASGGMATVYLARAVGPSGFTTEVALKLTHAHLRTSTEFANELIEEAKLAARIRHRNVVSIIDVGDDPHGLFLVMEYVEGDTLANITKGTNVIPTPMGVRLLIDALAGLHAAHELLDDDGRLLGVVHRDFTPQNILVGTDGVARLADFGIAKAATRMSHTRTGIVKGKISYMSPEQAQGLPLDRRCDVWAAGVVAWELFAGRRLYASDDDLSTMLRVATEPPPLLRTIVPQLPQAVEAAVAGALAMKPEGRHETALAFSKALATACRPTVGVAELDEVAAWMASHVTPKVSRQRVQAARTRAPRDAPEKTRVEGAQPLPEEDLISLHSEAVNPRGASTVLLPRQEVQEPGANPFTDGVSVVARHWRAARSIAPGPRAFVVAGVLGVLLVLSISVWRASAMHRNDRSTETQVAPAALPSASVTASADWSPVPAATSTTLRLRANAAIASLRVNDHDVPMARPASVIDVDLAGFVREPSLSIDAVTADGRHAGVAVPPGATQVRLEFPPPVPPPAPPPRPASPRPTSRTAPLAPSPYN